MTKHKNAEKMAEIIEEIYDQKFGGKSRGRFQISRTAFRQLSGRKRLSDIFIDEVAERALELGYVLVSLGDTIAIIEEQVMLNYRNVPKSIINKYLHEDEDEDDEKDDEKEEDEEKD